MTTKQELPVQEMRTSLDLILSREDVDQLSAFSTPDIDPIDDAVRLLIGDGHSGYGLYAATPDYPEEGAILVKNLPAPRAALAAQVEPPAVAWRFKERINGELDSDWILTKYEPADGVRIIAKEQLYAHPPAQQAEPIARAAVPVVQAQHWPILYAILRPAITSGNDAVRQHAERLAEVLDGDQRTALRELLDRPARSEEPARVVHSASGEAATARDAARYLDALVWALGAHDTDGFRERSVNEGPYWWRKELAERAGLRWNGDLFVSSTPAQGDDGGGVKGPVDGL